MPIQASGKEGQPKQGKPQAATTKSAPKIGPTTGRVRARRGDGGGDGDGDDEDQLPRRRWEPTDYVVGQFIKKFDRNALAAILEYIGVISLSFQPGNGTAARTERMVELPGMPGLIINITILEYIVSFLPYPVNITALFYEAEPDEDKEFRGAALEEFWKMIVTGLDWVNDDPMTLVNSFFYAMQWIGGRRVVGNYEPENVKLVLKMIYDKKDSNLHTMFAWQDFEDEWKEYFKDSDHFNEAHLVSDRELAQCQTLDPNILKEAAVRIMTLYLAIFRSGQNSGGGINAMMNEFYERTDR